MQKPSNLAVMVKVSQPGTNAGTMLLYEIMVLDDSIIVLVPIRPPSTSPPMVLDWREFHTWKAEKQPDAIVFVEIEHGQEPGDPRRDLFKAYWLSFGNALDDYDPYTPADSCLPMGLVVLSLSVTDTVTLASMIEKIKNRRTASS